VRREALPRGHEAHPALDVIIEDGTLARRLLRSAGASPSRERLREVYGRLADCLQLGAMFRAAD
jgi:hypothetical protein